jgi:hypothetical protein
MSRKKELPGPAAVKKIAWASHKNLEKHRWSLWGLWIQDEKL